MRTHQIVKKSPFFSKNKNRRASLPTFKGKGLMWGNLTQAKPHPTSLAAACLLSSQVTPPLSQQIQPSLGAFPWHGRKAAFFSFSRALCLALNKYLLFYGLCRCILRNRKLRHGKIQSNGQWVAEFASDVFRCSVSREGAHRLWILESGLVAAFVLYRLMTLAGWPGWPLSVASVSHYRHGWGWPRLLSPYS